MAATSKKSQDSPQTEAALTPVAIGENYIALSYDPTELGNLIDDYLEDGLKEGDLEQIKIPTGGGIQWEMPGAAGGEMVTTFDGVIVGVQTTRTYWPDAFSGASVPPSCTSRDGKIGIGDPGGVCELCPLARWGTGKNGVGTACAERKRVYILRPEGLLPIILNLPVTSINNLRKYQIRLLSQRTPVTVVVTRFGLDRTKNKAGIPYSQAAFTSIGPLPATLAPLAKAYAKTIQTAVGIHTEARPSAKAEAAAFNPDDQKAPFDADGIPESDPPFGPFARDARTETDEIPF
jgi:hypothetical protein